MSDTIGDLVDRVYREYLEPVDNVESYSYLSSGISDSVDSITYDGNLFSIEEEDALDAGAIGMMVIDPNIMPANEAFILDFAFIKPVFTNIPGYGTVFVRDIDQQADAKVAKAIYMEMGYDFGPPSYHLKIAKVA